MNNTNNNKPRLKRTPSDQTTEDNIPPSSSLLINLLICATGSVAAIKIPDMIRQFNSMKIFKLRIVLTKGAQHFITKEQIHQVDNSIECFTDEDEWSMWSKRGDPVLHIELRKWAQILLIAPLDCNTLAKISNGICDNLVTCVARAWDLKNFPFVVAPAMNTLMHEHPFTAKQLSILELELNVYTIQPICKLLACGDTGNGALASVETIANFVHSLIDFD
ncbi:predicted protein [Naegleria gruberi]|uniref:Predicted protein n=1 Tax=Naegleria gruberi TaxID=5762 RepID=D2VFG8_NAEGR|nr:uncharacterized protein NAEGRDRAFT_33695 [Naegleria gruberi]EFC44462.1 predicted protein [Naegleria gruberi]|eukprot:XP_002677206.1 predicted protein [Naegleria gruberi strain NEG-M]